MITTFIQKHIPFQKKYSKASPRKIYGHGDIMVHPDLLNIVATFDHMRLNQYFGELYVFEALEAKAIDAQILRLNADNYQALVETILEDKEATIELHNGDIHNAFKDCRADWFWFWNLGYELTYEKYFLLQLHDPNPDNPMVYSWYEDNDCNNLSEEGQLDSFLSRCFSVYSLKDVEHKIGLDSALAFSLYDKEDSLAEGKFSARGQGVQQLDGLEKHPSIEHLSLAHNRIHSLDFLVHFPMLKSLDISFNQITSLSGLEHCPLLESLNISNNQVQDISILAHLTSLKEIRLAKNNINNFSALANLKQVEKLSIFQYPLKKRHLENPDFIEKLKTTETDNPIDMAFLPAWVRDKVFK